MTDEEPESASPRDRAGVIGAVANALELLQLFAGGRPVHVNEASRSLDLSRSTVHRLLSTLAAYGYVEQEPTSRAYLPGPALKGIGLVAAQQSDVRGSARAALVELAEATGESVHVMILRGDHTLVLDSIESEQLVRTPSRAGWDLPSHSTAGGKVLLARKSDAEIKAIFPTPLIAGLSRVQPVRRADLLAELELVRARGYATNFGESEPDVSAVAVAFERSDGQELASLSVTAPRSRSSEEWARNVGRITVKIARKHARAGVDPRQHPRNGS